MNKTPISGARNRYISARAPSLRAIRSHHVPVELLEVDDFDGFFEARKVALLEVIGGAMGKPVLVQTTTDLAEAAQWEEAVLAG